MTANLEARMKGYEAVSSIKLVRRMPVVIRVDGKAFHTLTRGFAQPFDVVFRKTMCEVMQYLCENIENCVIGYTQSDEITLVLCDYATTETQAWFDDKVQKLCSISASMATAMFNKYFADNVACEDLGEPWNSGMEFYSQRTTHNAGYHTKDGAVKIGMFDSRCFNVPREDVENCLLWRQMDAERNSVQGLGQAYFSHSELHKKAKNDILNMLIEDRGVDWATYPTWFKRGACCIKEPKTIITPNGEEVVRQKWVLDLEIPVFSRDREYIQKRINIG